MAKKPAVLTGSLMERIKKTSTIAQASVMSDSKVYDKKEMCPTNVPIINTALSGQVDGGLAPGLFIVAAPSKHFKSCFALLLASAFKKKYPDGVILFYDSEFGTPKSYFDSFGIDTDYVFHSPITDIEQLKFDIIAQLDQFQKGDHVMIIVDSVGNLASKKEVEDARNKNEASDMTRTKQLKSLFRIVTPHLTLKDIPMVAIGHVYTSQDGNNTVVVSGGTGQYYSADNIWTVSRAQDADGKGKDKVIHGYYFNVKIEKSRYLKEGVRFPVNVTFEGGIHQWSGMFEEAMDAGLIVMTSAGGWYATVDHKTGEVGDKNFRRGDVEENSEFWQRMLTKTPLAARIKEKYSLSGGSIMSNVIDVGEMKQIEDQTEEA